MFVWLVSGTKRLAYQRIPARHLLYSMIDEEKGKGSGTVQTLFLKVSSYFPIGYRASACGARSPRFDPIVFFSGGRKRNAVSNVKIALSTVGTPSRSNSSLIFTMLLANISEKIKVSRYSVPVLMSRPSWFLLPSGLHYSMKMASWLTWVKMLDLIKP